MPATLTVTVSDAAFAHLQRQAAEQDTTPEALLAAAAEPPGAAPGAFLNGWAGSVRSDVADWGTRQDEWVGPASPGDAVPAEPPKKADADAFLKLAGMFSSGVSDAAERHDEYIGQALYDELRGGKTP